MLIKTSYDFDSTSSGVCVVFLIHIVTIYPPTSRLDYALGEEVRAQTVLGESECVSVAYHGRCKPTPPFSAMG